MEACWLRIIVFLKTNMIIYTCNKISCWSRCNIPVYVTSYVLRYVRLLMSIYRKLGSRNSAMEHIFYQATSFNYRYITYRMSLLEMQHRMSKMFFWFFFAIILFLKFICLSFIQDKTAEEEIQSLMKYRVK